MNTSEFTSTIYALPDGWGQRVLLHRGDQALSRREVIEGWVCDEAFRTFFIAVLAGAPYAAYFWETPPVKRDSVDRDFEFVWIESPSLASASPEQITFAEHFIDSRPKYYRHTPYRRSP